MPQPRMEEKEEVKKEVITHEVVVIEPIISSSYSKESSFVE
jgi:hypothetical protein